MHSVDTLTQELVGLAGQISDARWQQQVEVVCHNTAQKLLHGTSLADVIAELADAATTVQCATLAAARVTCPDEMTTAGGYATLALDTVNAVLSGHQEQVLALVGEVQ